MAMVIEGRSHPRLPHSDYGGGCFAVIEFVDATVIRIKYDRTEDEDYVEFELTTKEYKIPKFRRTNQGTTIDLRPICEVGQRVERGDILTEGYSTEKGEPLPWVET